MRVVDNPRCVRVTSAYGSRMRPFHQMPDPVEVPLDEMAEMFAAAELALSELRAAGRADGVGFLRLDAALAMLGRRVWPLLRELDDEPD